MKDLKAVKKLIKLLMKMLIVMFSVIGVALSAVYLHSLLNIINNNTGRADTEWQDILEDKELATTENPVLSPSKKFWLQIVKGFDGEVHFYQFYILKAGTNGSRTKEILFICPETFRTRDRTYFLWDKSDRIWVYSGDVGSFYWKKIGEYGWVKHTQKEDGVEEPEKLLRLTGW